MRGKKECLILTFPTTEAAMQWEKYCIAHGVSGRIITVPREITAGCGLAWKTEPEEEGGLMKNSIWRTNPEYAELLRQKVNKN